MSRQVSTLNRQSQRKHLNPVKYQTQKTRTLGMITSENLDVLENRFKQTHGMIFHILMVSLTFRF